ncbi:filamentous haemagglutinin family protein [Sphingobium sp. CAP-1]|uniref:filamentous haemagglutinin family protein n=1 Tax=Sphingobium sp. CAP-1 TaxID=2676077 RepID=UPI0018AD171E|nr:filamentous haemagglutinin family protein [Sphingobium sp. CAP-1]
MMLDSRNRRRTGLLMGVSLAGMCAANPAMAQIAVLRGAAGIPGVSAPAIVPRPASANPLTAAQQIAAAAAQANQTKTAAQLNLAQQAQAAARAAIAGVVPNGLVKGGLMPVVKPVAAASDLTGAQSWEGALAPVETLTGGKSEVVVTQTAKRAILSWESFNVGANTTLTFSQKDNGVAQKDWVALNRVVGEIDPLTGVRAAGSKIDPSQILGSIKADGTVLILNQAGVMFGATAQVNTHSLLVSSMEIGRATALSGSTSRALTLAERNREFLNYGLLGFRDQASVIERTSAYAFSPMAGSDGLEGGVSIAAGAQIGSGDSGFIMALAPTVTNAGTLTSANGQVSLQSGRRFFLERSEGTSTSINPYIRGLVVTSQAVTGDAADYVVNSGIMNAARGYVSLGASETGAVLQSGILQSSTSVARNGFIGLSGGDIRLDPGSLILLNPDSGAETIPQSADSVSSFKTSQIVIGSAASRIEMGSGSLLLAPSADVTIGAPSGLDGLSADDAGAARSRIFIDSGATIDVGGVKDYLVPASRNLVRISPVKGNELRDTPLYRAEFLNGTTVLVDPRLSGVREDGVRWIGSPLIEAASYYAQVGVTASELMTSGGNVTLGVAGFGGTSAASASDIIVKAGAKIDISGGWVRYEGGAIQTTRLLTRSGQSVDIGSADPNGDYVGVVEGYTESQPRFGLSTTYANPALTGTRTQAAYTEGRDAGSLTLKGSAIAFDGALSAQAYAGALQRVDAKAGTATSSVYGDTRTLQGSPSELPASGYLNVQGLSRFTNSVLSGAGDIVVTRSAQIDAVPDDLAFGQSFSIDDSGALLRPARDGASLLAAGRRDRITLSADLLNDAGLGQITLQTSGAITIADDVALRLADGGIFTGIAGRAITVDGSVTALGGAIDLRTLQITQGSIFADDAPVAGSFDIAVNGTLSTRGRWANDFGNAGLADGGAYLNGGSISLRVAPRVTAAIEGVANERADISGSILINDGALLDVSAGGYVDAKGQVDTSARGGNVSLINQTNYFQISPIPIIGLETDGNVPGIRVTTNPSLDAAANPAAITARVAIADGAIKAHGFAGGGSFTLETPAITFGDGTASVGTRLPLDFFADTGFADYALTSYGTALIENRFNNGLGGYNALLSTQTLTVGAGETLSLTQTRFNPNLSLSQQVALMGLATGGDLYSVLTPQIASDAYDRLGVGLTLGGLVELHVAQGGVVDGDAGSSLTVAKLWNEGRIRLVGGDLTQAEVLPSLYSGAIGAASLSDMFTTNADGGIDEDALNALGVADAGRVLTNAELALQPLYLTGLLAQDEGIRLSAGSRIDLSGASIRDPRAAPIIGTGAIRATGRLYDGGTLTTATGLIDAGDAFQRPLLGEGVYASDLIALDSVRVARAIHAGQGATIDLSGAADSYEILDSANHYVDQAVWSAGGALAIGGGGSVNGATIDAHGGATMAQGGTLSFVDPTLVQSASDVTRDGQIAADQIGASGFDTMIAYGALAGEGDVSLSLRRGFFLNSRLFSGDGTDFTPYLPTVSATGALAIDAPFIGFDSLLQQMVDPLAGATGSGAVRFSAASFDVRGAVLFDRSIASVTLTSSGDLRLSGVQPIELSLGLDSSASNSLLGQLVVNGDLTLNAARIYATTGSSFLVASTGAGSQIRVGRSSDTAAATPYSAGSNLLIQAARIEQGGALYAPLGTLTLGSTSALLGGQSPFVAGGLGQFAPATTSVVLTGGSVTSVSAKGLSIPYGTTTDQIEYYFSPTSTNPLTSAPVGTLKLAGTAVEVGSGATVDISGGGDVFAYEFVPGTGGSRDVLDRFNADPFSGNDGLAYPDGRQVYAIVPGLSAQAAAAFDPIYGADYGDLYGASAVGRSVYLANVAGLAPGWYTLLPAKYAVLPGGLRIVEQTGADTVAGGSAALRDGSQIVTGFFGSATTGLRESTLRTFSVQTSVTFRQYSNIVTTSATQAFNAQAARDGLALPRSPLDAGRIVLEPIEKLILEASLSTQPGTGGRGAQADISGQAFRIVSQLTDDAGDDGAIQLTAGGLTALGVQSLLIGGVRTEMADGRTALTVRAGSIAIENDAAHALTAPELLFATDGSASALRVLDGAVVNAAGALSDTKAADYLIDGSSGLMTGQGALLRVANGPERLVRRIQQDTVASAPMIDIGASTLTGTSVLISSAGAVRIDGDAQIAADNVALDAAQISFATKADGLDGLVITPGLRDAFASATHLTFRSPGAIRFESLGNGSSLYDFGAVTFDAAGFGTFGSDNADVTLTATLMRIANSGGTAAICTTDCGDGILAIETGSLSFGSGTFGLDGFGRSFVLTATDGIRFDGVGGIDADGADVSIHTPFLADAAITLLPGVEATLPSFSLKTTGALSIVGTPGATLPEGTPGAKLSLSAASVEIAGAHLRATAGSLDVRSSGDIVLRDGALLETPSYARQFGDAADPYLVSAAGGRLSLASLDGDLIVGSGATLNVGGVQGKAGSLLLRAAGQVLLGGTINGSAPDADASLAIDSGGGFDLDGFAAVPNGFTGAIDIRVGAGDLTLGSGRQINATSLLLAAEDGRVAIDGAIDTSGVNGGDISLYGRTGVQLGATARIDASADGYAATDTRQASAGDVTLGTDDGGAIAVASGATIDLRALRPGNRLVPIVRNGQTLFSYVDTDLGGTLTLRAPIIEQAGADSVDIAFGGSVTGARGLAVEAFKRWNLGTVAADTAFTGVTIVDGVALLDTAQVADGAVNFLAGRGEGTLSQFIQSFDISSSYAQLGGLALDPVFVARPGVELTYAGDIKLQSNWNFAAADVDVEGALAAGVMRNSTELPGKVVVNAGREAELIENYADFLYRVGGSIHGPSGTLSLRAGGDLTVAGSVSDGMFTFTDQTDPDYLATVLGGTGGARQVTIPFSCFGPQSCRGIVNFTNSTQFLRALVNFSGIAATSTQAATPARPIPDDMPFNALANSAAALGAGVDGAGDPLGSASLFPMLSDGSFASSWNYNFIGGADLSSGASALLPSIDPLRTDFGSTGSVSVEGQRSYSYGGRSGATVSDEVLLSNGGFTYGLDDFVADDGDQRRPRATGYSTISLVAGRYSAITTLLKAKAIAFFKTQKAGTFRYDGAATNPTAVSTTATLAEQFLASIQEDLTAVILDPSTGLVSTGTPQNVTTAIVRTLVRTGTGAIQVAAAGDVDLTNGAITTTRIGATAYQNGGTALYTVGHLAATGVTSATDMTIGVSYQVDPTAYLAAVPTNTEVASFRYGRGSQTALAGLLVADPAYLTGGGDISVGAAGSILGRRDVFNEVRAANASFSFIGAADQPWRVGSVGATVNLRVNPQLFTSGVGALGGGSIALDAGGDISDLTVSALASNSTADATSATGGAAVKTLVTWGSGNVALDAGGDLAGGTIDLAHGEGAVAVAGSIRTAGALSAVSTGDIVSNLLRVRVSDATIRFDIGASAQLQGVAALAARGAGNDPTTALNSFGFYSAASGIDLTANGRISIADRGISVVTGRTGEPQTAVYPATVNLASLTGDLILNADRALPGGAGTINLFPSSTGQLRLFAGGDIASATITMEDRDPGQLPGYFSVYSVIEPSIRVAGQDFNFPVVLPDTSSAERAVLHNSGITHLGDAEPVRIAAGGDALDLILSLPKQARISAGRDIVNMMLFSQNITSTDITRIVAGRDIIATTQLTRAFLPGGAFGDPLPALQGNSFVIGGPGAFFLEAGRDAGPFLNSAVVDPSRMKNGEIDFYGSLSMGGGVLSIGNEWNPALPEVGADLIILFGVAKGADYAALREAYLNPANIAALPDDLFVQVADVNGNLIADRTQPIYGPILLAWMKVNAAGLLTQIYGSINVTAQQAYDAFITLPALTQRSFLVKDVYFNELEMTSRPDGPSYLQYSRGYRAVNSLFSPALGYTENNLEGGQAGASDMVLTGNLDLRLATIQTARGGDIALLGPGGRILAGSTVRTSDQAARRTYDGTRLYAGDRAVGFGANGNPLLGFSQASPTTIQSIPTGYEGVITLRGGRVMSFTDGSLLLNQSRLFTQGGGDITLWSSNGDLNAGQGPKSAASFPPVVVRIDENGFSQVDAVGGVSGAGIAAFAPAVGVTPPDVFLIAPRGTVDAGDAGVRVAGNLFVAAAAVANADNFQVGGASIGVVSSPVVDAGAVAASNAASAAATEAAQAATGGQSSEQRVQIFVDVQGYAGGGDDHCKQTPRPTDCPDQ